MTLPPKDKIDKSLRASLRDGIFTGGMMGFTQDYFTPFLLLLGGTAKHVGILSSLPHFVAALVQLNAADFTEKVKSRRKVISIFILLQTMALLPVAWRAWTGTATPLTFILSVTLFTATGAFALPAWGSLMSDLVSARRRGDFFGRRNRILGLVMVSSTFVAGFILHEMAPVNIYTGFAIIFTVACVCRLISWYFLNQIYEVPIEHKKENYFNFYMFLRRIKESNFAKFVLFVAMFNFCVYLASPFFAVFMLRELQFNYLQYTVITITATLTIYLMMGRWGRHADQVGNLKVLRVTAPVIALLPALWVFNHHPVWLFFVQIISGFAWAGFNLCASNFIYDAVTPEKRTRCIAYFNVLNGLALCGGGLLGGFLIEKLPPFNGYSILMLFMISSILRLTVALAMPRKLKEVRSVEHISSNKLFFSMIGIKPMLGNERKTIET